MRRILPIAALLACSIVVSSCASYAYLRSDDYLKARIRIVTDRADVPDAPVVNRWSVEFDPSVSAHDVGVWVANRLAHDGRHDLVVLAELISVIRDIHQSENMWRILIYPVRAPDNAE